MYYIPRRKIIQEKFNIKQYKSPAITFQSIYGGKTSSYFLLGCTATLTGYPTYLLCWGQISNGGPSMCQTLWSYNKQSNTFTRLIDGGHADPSLSYPRLTIGVNSGGQSGFGALVIYVTEYNN